jgi:hypothetical protein
MADDEILIGGGTARVGDKVWRVRPAGNLVMFRIRGVLELDGLLETWLVDCEGERHPPGECFLGEEAAIKYFTEAAEARAGTLEGELSRLKAAALRAMARRG